MKCIEEAVVERLLAAGGVRSYVAQRVYVRLATQAVEKPYIVVTKLPNERHAQCVSGSAGVTESYISVTAWDATYEKAVQAATAADTEINLKKGMFGEVFVSFCLRQDGYDQSQLPALDDDVGFIGYRLIYKICHAA